MSNVKLTARRRGRFFKRKKMATGIRNAVESDLQAIVDIYNESVINSVATFDTQTKTMEDRR